MRPHPHRTPPTITAVEPKKAHGAGYPQPGGYPQATWITAFLSGRRRIPGTRCAA
ncbi:hypothetical protein GFS60_00603 [Rhodococcus sp. WAY2]|nr:hypothetical protein GFS60_00603 [Rhodococcus sp. WAY2]